MNSNRVWKVVSIGALLLAVCAQASDSGDCSRGGSGPGNGFACLPVAPTRAQILVAISPCVEMTKESIRKQAESYYYANHPEARADAMMGNGVMTDVELHPFWEETQPLTAGGGPIRVSGSNPLTLGSPTRFSLSIMEGVPFVSGRSIDQRRFAEIQVRFPEGAPDRVQMFDVNSRQPVDVHVNIALYAECLRDQLGLSTR